MDDELRLLNVEELLLVLVPIELRLLSVVFQFSLTVPLRRVEVEPLRRDHTFFTVEDLVSVPYDEVEPVRLEVIVPTRPEFIPVRPVLPVR